MVHYLDIPEFAFKTPMAQVTYQGFTFSIPDEVQEKYKELIQLVLDTPSMTQDEKQYWFKILPIMNKEQLRTLYTILATEKQKLNELDNKYSSELAKLGKKESNFDPAKAQQVRAQLQNQEAQEEKQESDDAQKLLQELDNL